mmetsp:Transcript_11067/g.25093  ORF Transcript_11067/g.25093 Transcript_11067/m.25093 type:complete len:277 (-) Transcript_11067:111-941(-)
MDSRLASRQPRSCVPSSECERGTSSRTGWRRTIPSCTSARLLLESAGCSPSTPAESARTCGPSNRSTPRSCVSLSARLPAGRWKLRGLAPPPWLSSLRSDPADEPVAALSIPSQEATSGPGAALLACGPPSSKPDPAASRRAFWAWGASQFRPTSQTRCPISCSSLCSVCPTRSPARHGRRQPSSLLIRSWLFHQRKGRQSPKLSCSYDPLNRQRVPIGFYSFEQHSTCRCSPPASTRQRMRGQSAALAESFLAQGPCTARCSQPQTCQWRTECAF